MGSISQPPAFTNSSTFNPFNFYVEALYVVKAIVRSESALGLQIAAHFRH